MSASIEIGAGAFGVGGAQALAGGSSIAVGVAAGFDGVSGAGRSNLGEKSAAAPGESFQSRWRSTLALLGGHSAQPGDAVRETDESHNPEGMPVGNLSTGSAPQCASIASTCASTGEDQDGRVTASARAAGSHVFGAMSMRSDASRTAQLPLNPGEDVGSEGAGRTSASRSLAVLNRRPGKQAVDETSNSSKTHDTEQATSLLAVAPVALAAPPLAISMRREAYASAAAASARAGAKSFGNGAPRESADLPAKDGSTSSMPAPSGKVAGLRSGLPESSEARLSPMTETTLTADRAGVSLEPTLSSPELQVAEKNASDRDADANAVETALTPAATGASAHTTPPALRFAGANGGSDASASQGMHPIAVQSIAAPDVTAVSHTPVGLHGGMHPAGENSSGINGAGATSAVSSRETFAALDAEPGSRAPAWLHASAQRAEAGFNDPALGWVGVRADMGPGGVHAAIVPGSADAAQTLSSHMAGLNAHLTAEHVPVESIRLATATGSEGQGGTQQGTAQNHGQGAEQQSQAPVPSGSLSSSSASVSADGVGDTVGESAHPVSNYTGGLAHNGAHISVIA